MGVIFYRNHERRAVGERLSILISLIEFIFSDQLDSNTVFTCKKTFDVFADYMERILVEGLMYKRQVLREYNR